MTKSSAPFPCRLLASSEIIAVRNAVEQEEPEIVVREFASARISLATRIPGRRIATTQVFLLSSIAA